VKRAVSLLMHEVAERVEESGKVLRSPNAVFPVPSVIRLKRFVRTPFRQRVAFNRKNVFRRDDHVCQYCGRHTHDLTLDHVVPRSRGGEHTWENCVACCAPCNHRKADKLLTELGWTLRVVPNPPKGRHWRLLATLPELHPTWLPYLGEGAA